LAGDACNEHVLTAGGAQTAAASVSVRMRHHVTLTVENAGVLGAGEGSSVVRRVHLRIMGKTVLSNADARMVAPVITYLESVAAHQAGWGPYVRIAVLKESTEKNACQSVAVKMGEPAIPPRASATVLQVGPALCVPTGVHLELGVTAVT